MNLMDRLHIIGGLVPEADALAGTKYTDIFEVLGEGAGFLIFVGENDDNAQSTITVEACDDVTPSNSTAVAFQYRACTTFDSWGDWTQATTTGFSTSGTSNNMYLVYVPAAELASEGYGYARMKAVESDDHPVDACIVAFIVNPRDMEVPYSVID